MSYPSDELVAACREVLGQFEAYESDNDALSLRSFERLLRKAESLIPEFYLAIDEMQVLCEKLEEVAAGVSLGLDNCNNPPGSNSHHPNLFAAPPSVGESVHVDDGGDVLVHEALQAVRNT